MRGGTETDKEGPQGTFQVMKMLSVLFVVGVTQGDIYLKINEIYTWNGHVLLFANYTSISWLYKNDLAWCVIILPFPLGSQGQPPWKGQHRMKEETGSASLSSIWKLFASAPPHEMACMTQTFGFSHADFLIPTVSIRTLLVAHVRTPIQTSLDSKVGRGCFLLLSRKESSASDMARSRA